MIKSLFAIPILLVCSTFAFAEPVVKLPKEVKVAPGRLVKLKAETENKYVLWLMYSDDADLIPSESTKSAIFSSPVPGVYKIIAITAEADIISEPAICNVIVGEGPTPPDPVLPTDPFFKALKEAYDKEPSSDKAHKKDVLMNVYKTAVTSTINNPTIKTAGQLLTVLRDSANAGIGTDLGFIREVIRKELDTKLPLNPNELITDVNKPVFISAFGKIVDYLGKVK